MGPYKELFCKGKPGSLQVKQWQPILITPHTNSTSGSRTYDLAQIWFNLASSRLNSLISINTISHHQGTGIDVPSLSLMNKRSDNKIATSSSNMHGLLLRCIPTAACLSHKSNPDVTTSSSADDKEEDSLPGVRVRRKGYTEQRVNAQISEQDINEWLKKESGMDRVRMMYAIGHDGSFIQEDTKDLNVMFFRTIVLGTVVNAVSTFLSLDVWKKEKSLSNTQALLKGLLTERNVVKKVLAGSLTGTLKLTVLAALMLHGSQAIAAYRNKSSVVEYVLSSSLAFGLLGLGHGVKRCAYLSLRGAAVGTLGGYVVCKILDTNGLNQEQKHLESVRHHLREQKLMKQQEGIL